MPSRAKSDTASHFPNAAVGEQRRRLKLLLLVRLAVFTALLGSSLLFPLRGGVDAGASFRVILALVIVVYLATALSFWAWRRGRPALALQAQLQLVFDILAAVVLVYLTGGIESPFSFFLAIPVIVAAVWLSRRGTLLVAGLACLVLGVEYILESQGMLPLELLGRVGKPPGTERAAYLLSVNFAMLLAVGWLAGTLGEQLRRTGRTLEATREDLARLEALHRDIVASLLSGLVALDEQGRVSLANRVAEQILGVDSGQLEGKRLAEVSPELAGLLPRSGSPEVSRVEIDLERPAGPVPVGVTVSPLKNADGQWAGTLLHMQDLTQRRRMEESVKRAEKMAALGQMAAGLAHEIRNPLASISGSVQMLGAGRDDDQRTQRLRRIVQRETHRLDRLLRDFLSFARPQEPRRRPLRLDELAREVCELFESSWTGSRLQLRLDLEPVRVVADPDQLRQVLHNLLQNGAQAAGEAAGQQPRLLVAVRPSSRRPGMVELEVADNGPPMAPEVRRRLFEPFFTTKAEGSGLGLAIASSIVRAHGGEIGVEVDGGNRFVVTLPSDEAE